MMVFFQSSLMAIIWGRLVSWCSNYAHCAN